MCLAEAFFQSELQCIQSQHCFYWFVCSLEIRPWQLRYLCNVLPADLKEDFFSSYMYLFYYAHYGSKTDHE